MATFNQTKVYLYTKIEKETTMLYRVPAVSESETFFYNHEPIQVIIYTGSHYCISKSASIHLTDHRLIFISQFNSLYADEPDRFDTCEFLLGNFRSLKHKYQDKDAITFHIVTLDQTNIRIDMMFPKGMAKSRESVCEYLGMAVMDMRRQQPAQEPVLDGLPTYSEATRPPPSYSN
ncbi:hypothetical protein K501DRAFT_269158 [Backusella circina FSU 941]|nr:hypothetical protein K501DRAFT_269158 [Backusella circina FSU 941]